MSQSHCSPVVAISDRQSNRLQNRFDLIQIICYMKFMFVNICKIGLLVLVVKPKYRILMEVYFMDSCDSTGRNIIYGEKQHEILAQPSMGFI